MTLRLDIQPGGEKYFSFAKQKLAQLKQWMLKARMGSFTKHFKIDNSDIWVNSVSMGAGAFLDFIRITAGAVWDFYFATPPGVPMSLEAAEAIVNDPVALAAFAAGLGVTVDQLIAIANFLGISLVQTVQLFGSTLGKQQLWVLGENTGVDIGLNREIVAASKSYENTFGLAKDGDGKYYFIAPNGAVSKFWAGEYDGRELTNAINAPVTSSVGNVPYMAMKNDIALVFDGSIGIPKYFASKEKSIEIPSLDASYVSDIFAVEDRAYYIRWSTIGNPLDHIEAYDLEGNVYTSPALSTFPMLRSSLREVYYLLREDTFTDIYSLTRGFITRHPAFPYASFTIGAAACNKNSYSIAGVTVWEPNFDDPFLRGVATLTAATVTETYNEQGDFAGFLSSVVSSTVPAVDNLESSPSIVFRASLSSRDYIWHIFTRTFADEAGLNNFYIDFLRSDGALFSVLIDENSTFIPDIYPFAGSAMYGATKDTPYVFLNQQKDGEGTPRYLSVISPSGFQHIFTGLAAGPFAQTIENWGNTNDVHYVWGMSATDEVIGNPPPIRHLFGSDGSETHLTEDANAKTERAEFNSYVPATPPLTTKENIYGLFTHSIPEQSNAAIHITQKQGDAADVHIYPVGGAVPRAPARAYILRPQEFEAWATPAQ